MLALSLLFLLCAAAALAARQEIETAPYATRGELAPRGWTRLPAAPSSGEMIELQFALKRNSGRVDQLRSRFQAVSDPDHKDYGKHLTQAEAAELLRPLTHAEETVRSWLAAELRDKKDFAGLASISAAGPARELLLVRVPVPVAEHLLATTFHRFEHQHSKMVIMRASRYTVAEQVAEVVDFVGGVLHFPEPFRVRGGSTQRLLSPDGRQTNQAMDAAVLARAAKAKGNVSETFGFGVTPRFVRDRYECSSAEGGKAKQNRQAAASFLGQYFDEVDLQEFYGLFMQEMVGRTPDKVVGSQGLIPGVEANLDVQYITSIGLYTSTWVYSTQGLHDNQEPFLKWMSLVANETDAEVPKAISISYGDNEDSISPVYMDRVDVEAQHLGARGISLLFASGDSGVGCNNAGNAFTPNFPVDLPSVTAVGGTTTNGFLEDGPEVCNSLSGGGFSNRYPAPSYQKDAIAKFFKDSPHLPASHFYNATGRGYPDVAAFSSGFWVTYAGIPTPVAGTSCAAPSFGAVVGLLNEVRYEQQKPTLGFLNPLFYKLGGSKGFHDAQKYCNSGCPSNNGIGFCAIPGWDAATGWGSPNFSELAKLI